MQELIYYPELQQYELDRLWKARQVIAGDVRLDKEASHTLSKQLEALLGKIETGHAECIGKEEKDAI